MTTEPPIYGDLLLPPTEAELELAMRVLTRLGAQTNDSVHRELLRMTARLVHAKYAEAHKAAERKTSATRPDGKPWWRRTRER